MGMPRKYSTATFITVLRNIHGDRYNYSKVVYTQLNHPVIINCPAHGDFNAFPAAILNPNAGCPICRPTARVLTRDKFIAKCTPKFGDKFDYSKIPDRFSPMDKVDIKCPTHGWFKQLARSHMYDTQYGCSKCGAVGTSIKLSKLRRERKTTPIELPIELPHIELSQHSLYLNSLRPSK